MLAWMCACGDDSMVDGGERGRDGGRDAARSDGAPRLDVGTDEGDAGPSAIDCSSTDVVLCEDFEAGLDAWIVEGSATHETGAAFTHGGAGSLRVDFRDPDCGPESCSADGNNCFENLPQVVSTDDFDLARFYVSWWVYYPPDFTFYQGPCLPARGAQGHFVRFANFHTPRSSDDSFYQAVLPDFTQERAGPDAIAIRSEWIWVENESRNLTVGRNMQGTEMLESELAGRWNHYELAVDLGAVGGFDGSVAWSVNDVVRFALASDAVATGSIGAVWGDRSEDAEMHPGLLRTSPEGFTRLGLVSNPNSSFGGRPGDVYWIDDVLIASSCPSDRPVCAR